MRIMFLLVRDEDVPTVAEAITAYATEEGLDVAPDSDAIDNPLGMLAMLAQPRAHLSMSGDSVVVTGLDTLDLADADEWASTLSSACSTEVLAFDLADDGVRVFVYDDGEQESEIEVPLSPTGRSVSRALAELADGDAARRELEAGIVASSPDELAAEILRCFGVTGPSADTLTLTFSDPIGDEAAAEASLRVDPAPGTTLSGVVGGALVSPLGYAFAVSLVGADTVEGVRLEIGGDALALLTVDAIDVVLRVRGTHDRVGRQVLPEMGTDGRLVASLDDALLERVDVAAPTLDMADMFSSMQRLMSATEAQQRNTLIVGLSAHGRRAGEGELALSASAPGADAAPGQGSISVRVG
jgi:hypothetical protein